MKESEVNDERYWKDSFWLIGILASILVIGFIGIYFNGSHSGLGHLLDWVRTCSN